MDGAAEGVLFETDPDGRDQEALRESSRNTRYAGANFEAERELAVVP